MRIIHLLRGRLQRDRADGIAVHTFGVSSAQRGLGHDVAIVGLSGTAKAERRWRSPDGIELLVFPVRGGNIVRIPSSLSEWLHRQDGDAALHVQVPFEPSLARVAYFWHSLGRRFFWTPHALWNPEMLKRGRLKKGLYATLVERRLVGLATGIHATAVDEVKDIKAFIGDEAPIYVCRSAVDVESLRRQVDTEAFSWKEFFPSVQSPRVFAFLGRLDVHQKGLDLLIQGWVRFSKGHPSVCLALMGPSIGDSAGRLRNLAAQSGLDGSRFVMTGVMSGSRKISALSQSHYYVQVSRAETTPYSIQEALSLGLPCILSNETNLADVVEGSNAGVGVGLSPAAIASGLERVYALDAAAYEAASKAAAALADVMFDPGELASCLINMYRVRRGSER